MKRLLVNQSFVCGTSKIREKQTNNNNIMAGIVFGNKAFIGLKNFKS